MEQLEVKEYKEEEDYEELHKELVALREISAEINSWAHEQSSELNFAEQEVSQVHQDTKEAGNELKKASKYQSSTWKWWIGGGMSVLGGAVGAVGGPVGIGIGSSLGGTIGASFGKYLEKKQKQEVESVNMQ